MFFLVCNHQLISYLTKGVLLTFTNPVRVHQTNLVYCLVVLPSLANLKLTILQHHIVCEIHNLRKTVIRIVRCKIDDDQGHVGTCKKACNMKALFLSQLRRYGALALLRELKLHSSQRDRQDYAKLVLQRYYQIYIFRLYLQKLIFILFNHHILRNEILKNVFNSWYIIGDTPNNC